MRILIAATHSAIVGGAETYLRNLIPGLRQRGHAVAVVASFPSPPGAVSIAHHEPDEPLWTLANSDRAETLAAIEHWKPDVVYSHEMASTTDDQALLDRFPVAYFAHGHSGTCISGTKTHASPTYQACRKPFGPACLLHYFPRRCGGLNPLTMIGDYRRAESHQRLLRRYDAVIVASRFMVAEFLQNGVSEQRIHRNPLFPPGMTPDASLPSIWAPTDRVLMIGRLYRMKGSLRLIEVMKEVNERLGRSITTVVAGAGPDLPLMEKMARQYGIRFECHGWVDNDKRVALMRGADLLVVPSIGAETFGLVGIEAGCVGLPAAGFDIGGISDWLIPGVSGELVAANSPRARDLAEAIVRILKDPEYRRRLSRGAWQIAQAHSRDRHIAGLESIFDGVISLRRLSRMS